MALPTSGQIRAANINSELNRSSTSTLSIDTAENGGYGSINGFSPSRPNSSNPASFSEWYGYDHDAGSGGFGFEQRLAYDPGNFDDACSLMAFGDTRGYRTEVQDWPSARELYSDISGTRRAVRGWYAEGLSNLARFWDGNRFANQIPCRV